MRTRTLNGVKGFVSTESTLAVKDVKASRTTSLKMDDDVASSDEIRFAYDGEDCDDDDVRTYPNKKSRLSDRAKKMAAFVSEAVI